MYDCMYYRGMCKRFVAMSESKFSVYDLLTLQLKNGSGYIE